jgi:hypothetical protein
METYIAVMFWVGILGIFIRALEISHGDYPRRVNYSIGEDVFLLLSSIAFVSWAGVLLYT